MVPVVAVAPLDQELLQVHQMVEMEVLVKHQQ
jgi:hypothetical protein